MKILVASGSFKDVFNPIEACEMIGESLDQNKNQIARIPICDGGEYTYEVLKKYFFYQEEYAENILNAFGQKRTARYLVKGDEAHIVSSEILRLYPEEDEYKNPLKLTDYGLGQMLFDAVHKGYRKIKLYIGGTSTVCCGMGFIQALGCQVIDKIGNSMNVPMFAEDLYKVGYILKSIHSFSDIELQVIADGDAKSFEMSGITGLKVGKTYAKEKQIIIEQTNAGVKNIIDITGISEGVPFSGAAGGLLFGIEQIFHPEYLLGGAYFAKLLLLEDEIVKADLIITGEGRFDNTACGKTPASVASLARRHNKPVVFVCGQIAQDAVTDYSGGIVVGEREKTLRELGISKLLTCQEYYDRSPLQGDYIDHIERFRKQTPIILKELFKKENL